MRVFISWSGPTSRCIAESLQKWLPRVLQNVEPFISTEIEKGAQWAAVISQQLKRAHAGIVCLTPENLQSRWLHYEAGALAKAVETAQAPENSGTLAVWTYLFRLDYSAVEYPLAQFQHTVAIREDTHRLVQSINQMTARYGEKPLTSEILDDAFVQWWPRLEGEFAKCGALEQRSENVQHRSERQMIQELLGMVRELRSGPVPNARDETEITRTDDDGSVGATRIPVSSATVVSVGYEPEHQILEVEFSNGAVYQYFDVPEKDFRALLLAPSTGAYFSNHIKAKSYRFVKRR